MPPARKKPARKRAPKKVQSEPKPSAPPEEPTKALLDKQNAEKAELREKHNRRRAQFGE